MRRIVGLAAIIACLAIPAVAGADTRATAQDRAQNHVQNPGCGDGLSWSCTNRYYIPESCYWNYDGAGYWDCHGITDEWRSIVNYSCSWYVHIRNDAIFFWHDLCRGRYGTSRLG